MGGADVVAAVGAGTGACSSTNTSDFCRRLRRKVTRAISSSPVTKRILFIYPVYHLRSAIEKMNSIRDGDFVAASVEVGEFGVLLISRRPTVSLPPPNRSCPANSYQGLSAPP